MDSLIRQESPMDVVDSAGQHDEEDRPENEQMETTEAVPVPLVDSTTGLTINRRTHMVEPTSPAAVHADDAARSASLADNSSDSEKMEEDDDSRAEGTIDFVVPDVRKLSETGSHSSVIQVRGLPWRIMAMKRKARQSVNHLHDDSYTLGFFLQCNMDSESPSWTCHAQAKMRLLSWKEGVAPNERQVSHMFYNKENDWGFTNFMTFEELLDPAKGYVEPTSHSIHLQVFLHADPPHGVCWDSKKYTGFIGLKNQGATCYMNSLLQALFFTNKLRKAVYLIPTEADDPVRSVPLAIQRVFYELQSSDKPVGTKKLTKSFGWETLDSFMQHDAQELCRVLLDNMDTKMKGTRVEGTIPSLFEGKMISFIRCKNVDYESSREESFMDIQLNVKDMKDVYDSFDDYVKVEVLEGDNKYDAGDHGLQDAEKGIAFVKFPPVLHLQLKRFQFDPVSENNIKINDRFEFPETLDLRKYQTGPSDVPPVYFLSAVLVHSGDNHGGHYVVYINPKGDGKWCKFDDDVVVRASRKEAVERNYGGSTDDFHQFRSCTNAYMLVYINEAMKDEILAPVEENGIPGYLSHRLAEEREVEARRRKEKAEQGQYLNLRLVTEDDMALHQGHDLVDIDKILQRKPYRVRKDFTLHKFRQVLADWFGYKAEEINFWPWRSRPTGGTRPLQIHLTGINLMEHHVLELLNNFHISGAEEDDLVIFLEILPLRNPRSGLQEGRFLSMAQTRKNSSSDDPHTYFFRLYDPVRRTLEYKGWDVFPPTKISAKELTEACNQKTGLPLNTPLFIYLDVKPTVVDKLITADQQPNRFSPNFDLQDGDLIVFQKQLTAEEDARLALPGVRDYFKDLTFRTDVEFVDKERQNDDSCTFSLTLNLKMAYTQVIRAVAAKLKTDPKRIQLFRNQSTSVRDCPGAAIGTDTTLTLRDIFQSSRTNSNKPKKLFYTHLDMDIDEMEARKEMKILWQPNFREEGKDLNILVNKRGTVKDLLDMVKKQVELATDGTGQLRLVELSGYKIHSTHSAATQLDSLSSISGNKIFRVEEVPHDQLRIESDELLIPVAHFHKEIHQCFGIPFYLKVRTNEQFFEVKERIRKILDVPEKDFEKYKFCISHLGKQTYLEDDNYRISAKDLNPQAVWCGTIGVTTWLGIDHLNKTPKRPRPSYLEKAVKIYN